MGSGKNINGTKNNRIWTEKAGGGACWMKPSKALAESVVYLASQVSADAMLILNDDEKNWGSFLFLKEFANLKRMRLVVATTDDEIYRHLQKISELESIKLTAWPRDRGHKVIHAIACGLNRGIFSAGDRLVCLAGDGFAGDIDSILVRKVLGNEPMFGTLESNPVLGATVELALELGHPGARGEPVGAAFMVGDALAVMRYSRQLMPNPFKGHSIGITDRRNWELLKRYAIFDGAFVVDDRGQILTGMRYLEANAQVEILPGLGTRHRAVAAMTAATRATGVTVSGEDGAVRVFKRGKLSAKIHSGTRTLEP